jgi:endonuclease III
MRTSRNAGKRQPAKAPGGIPGIPASRRETAASRSGRARRIGRSLADAYPDARCMLDHRGPFELLIATILAAQCTDERVNLVTPALFARFPDAAAMAAADVAELESLIRSTGFFRAKARSVLGASRAITVGLGGRFPQTMEGLLALPGVGRKTANVILGTCFGRPAIIVDTHVRRVAVRLGLAASNDPDRIEKELAVLLPEKSWTRFSHGLTFHGRRVCAARKPLCGDCAVHALCPSRLEGESPA